MQKTVIAAVAVLLSASAAYAADLGGSYKDGPVMINTVPNWAGLYVGGAVGFGVGDTTEKDLNGLYPDDTLDVNGAIYGIHLGYNFQRGTMVLGAEAAFNGTNIDGVLDSDTAHSGTYTLKRKLDWYSTLTGRIGYAPGNTLFYGLGGAAWGRHKTTESVVGDTVVTDFNVSDSKTKLGWTAGLGIEHAFTDRFSTRIEYAHVDLGSQKIFDGAEKVDMSFDTIKIGASFKLTGEREPLK